LRILRLKAFNRKDREEKLQRALRKSAFSVLWRIGLLFGSHARILGSDRLPFLFRDAAGHRNFLD
jgi:hypothetical protein